MSTAMHLQDIDPYKAEADSATHRRTVYHAPMQEQSYSLSSNDDHSTSPHDAISTALPLDNPSFQPNRLYWIPPHNTFSSSIQILNLSNSMASTPYAGLSSSYKEHIKEVIKDYNPQPSITVKKQNWMGFKYEVLDSQNVQIAEWKHPWTSMGTATLSFPHDSTHSSHPVSLKNKHWTRRAEAFIVNSITYLWEMDSFLHSQTMTLYKMLAGDKKVEIGKFANKWWGAFVTGGALVLDCRELDEVVAVLSACVVLRKRRQRTAEKAPMHAAGGGGS